MLISHLVASNALASMDADPAQAFYGDDKVDLYDTLGLPSSATAVDIRKAYRRLSLLHHPDKVASQASEAQEAAKATFQRIGYAYAVLNDEKRRERYDRTGKTSELVEGLVEPEEGWEAYFAEMFSGEVSSQTLDDFFDSYEGACLSLSCLKFRKPRLDGTCTGGEDEKEDLHKAYNDSKGDIEHILAHVPARDNTLAEARFTTLINASIDAKELASTTAWKKNLKDTKAKAKRAKAAEKEAKEAEKAAKEIGVHDKLFGNGKKGKGKQAEGDEDALKALIQQQGAKRMEALIDNLESKYSSTSNGKVCRSLGFLQSGGNRAHRSERARRSKMTTMRSPLLNRKSEQNTPSQPKRVRLLCLSRILRQPLAQNLPESRLRSMRDATAPQSQRPRSAKAARDALSCSLSLVRL